jgi:hypothetical protein
MIYKVKDSLRTAKLELRKMYNDEFGFTKDIIFNVKEQNENYFLIELNGILYEYQR